jgi:Ca2+:H+ antiporter
MMAVALAGGVGTGLLTHAGATAVPTFAVSAVAPDTLAAVVGHATDELGSHLGPGLTGVIQSAVGNLPELFVCLFALEAGLVDVVRGALIGSILANSLLVLGCAFVAGALRHGRLRFASESPRMIATLLMLAVAALAMPTLAAVLHTPAAGHEGVLAIVCALLLLGVFLTTIPATLRDGVGRTARAPGGERSVEKRGEAPWPLWLALAVLVAAGTGAAFVSDWFVAALEPAIIELGISQAFAGLVIVAIAGNAVEHVVGVQFAARGKADLAVSVILNSSLQVALVVIPVIVLASWFITGAVFTLVLPPLLLAALFLTAILGAVIVFDGRADLVEGAALVGLYGIIAAAFWWG